MIHRALRGTQRRLMYPLVVIGLCGCGEKNVFQAPPPPPVTVQRPVVKEVTTYKAFTGRAEAVDTVDIRARVRGFLKSVDFEPGQPVRAGDPDDPEDRGNLLFTIEPEPFVAAVNAAKAELAQGEAARDLAKVTLDRAKVAFDSGAVSELEMAEREAQLDGAQAAVDAAQAKLEQVDIDLSYTVIRTPISGRISRERVDVGNLVGANEATLLTTVVQDDPIYAYISVSERDLLSYIKDGRPRDRQGSKKTRGLLQLANGTTYEHDGVLDFAEPRVDPTTGTLEVRATFPNPDGKLYPGLFVRVLVPDVTGEQMLVPEVAILRDLAGDYVLVADGQNVVQRRNVELADKVDTDRVVTSGLEASDRVIVNGIQRAIPGNPVDPQLREPADASGASGPDTD